MRRAAIAATESSLTVSATASAPAGRPSTATSIGVLPSAASRRADALEFGGVDAGVGEQLAVADEHRVALDGGADALAGDRSRSRSAAASVEAAVAGAGDDGGGQRVFAVGFGGGDQRSSSCFGDRPGDARRR